MGEGKGHRRGPGAVCCAGGGLAGWQEPRPGGRPGPEAGESEGLEGPVLQGQATLRSWRCILKAWMGFQKGMK